MKKIKETKCTNNQEKVNSISYLTLFTFASKWDKFLIGVSLVAIFVAGVSMPFAISLVANAFQTMIDYAVSVKAGTPNTEKFLKSMYEFGINYSCVGFVLFACGYVGTALIDIAAINQVYRIRVSYLQAILNQDLAYYDLHQTGDFASKMAEDMIKLEEGIGNKVSSLVYNSTVSIGCITMALVKGWKLALLCLSTAPITFLLVGVTGKIANKLYKKEALAKGIASAVAEEALGSIKTVYAFNGQQMELDRYKKPLAEAKRIFIKKGELKGSIKEFFTGMSMGFLYLCIFSSYALAFYLGIYLVINEPNAYNADVMFSVFFGVMTALSYFGVIGHLMSTFGSAQGAGAHIFHILNKVPSINPLLDKGVKPNNIDGNIELKNIFFQYPARPSISVLNDVNIVVPSGKSVALIGQSGSGKSTIISLVARFYDVSEGSIKVDGHDVRNLSVCWLRRQIGLVRQEPVLFDASISENIRFGCEEASDMDIIDAARKANAHDFIMKLPAGYDTQVGHRGASLSGGQKQRIAIARALVRNPRILLLDEATSALDTMSEAKVQEALNEAAKGRTTIIVAHRLSTIRSVDMIYVLQHGRVIEMGTHEDLMKKQGQYYNMFRTSEVNRPDVLDVNVMGQEIRPEQLKIFDDNIIVAKDLLESKTNGPSLSFWQVLALNAPEWKLIVLGSLCSIISGFSMPLFIIAFGGLFGSMSNSDPIFLMNKVKDISILCICIGGAMGLANLIETVSFGIAGERLTERLRLRMFTHLLRQDVAYFEGANSTGALCAKLSADAAYVQGATGQRIGVILQGVGSIGLALFLAMWYEWRVGLVALAFLPFIVIVIWQQGKATYRESVGYSKSLETSTKIAVEAVSNIRTVASLGRERSIVQRYSGQLQPALAPARRAAHWRGLVGGLSRSIFNFVNAASLTYGGFLIVSDGIAYQNILITTQSLQMASSQAQNAFAYAPDFQKGINAAGRILELLTNKPKITDPVAFMDSFKATGKASLNKVEFQYPNRPNVNVLHGFDLQILPGKTIALIGQSGCGKSTVIQLLQRYYDPTIGTVVLDDVPVNKLRINDVRASFGVVAQEPVLFERSIRENIAYGDNSKILYDEEIIEAAKQANIHDFIVSLPEGYDTDIGSKGIQLSGGQKQRVAIARALIRQPSILILDEATSALDNESEKVVQEALDAAKAGRTCVMIAHRLSTVRDADAICVLSDGRVVESGTHSQLVQQGGIYYNLLAKGL